MLDAPSPGKQERTDIIEPNEDASQQCHGDDVRTDEAAAVEEGQEVLDCLPLISEAVGCKDKGNTCVKQKKYNEAVKAYEQGLEILHRSRNRAVLREEQDNMDSVKVALHANIAQCMLHLQLYRRAVDACSECLILDRDNVKALYRRSQAYEALEEWEPALKDALALRKLGGGGMDVAELGKRCEKLVEKQYKENSMVNKYYKDNEDLFKMKERFDEVLDKYDLGDGYAAPEVAQWLVTDNNFDQTVQRVAKRWQMSMQEANHFARWISKGLEMKVIPDPRAVQAPC